MCIIVIQLNLLSYLEEKPPKKQFYLWVSPNFTKSHLGAGTQLQNRKEIRQVVAQDVARHGDGVQPLLGTVAGHPHGLSLKNRGIFRWKMTFWYFLNHHDWWSWWLMIFFLNLNMLTVDVFLFESQSFLFLGEKVDTSQKTRQRKSS